MINILKRDGTKEPIQLDKIHKVLEWACEGLNNVSISEIELRAKLQFFDCMRTSQIQETLIKSAANLISAEAPDYQYVAGRLVSYHLRKEAFFSYTPPALEDQIEDLVYLDMYDPMLLHRYTKEEMRYLDGFIDHDLDNFIPYAGMEQLRTKYLVQNRVTKQVYETPQFINMLVPMMLFINYKGEERLDYITRMYSLLAKGIVSLPTPIMAGVRTPVRQYSSCVLIETDDSLNSIATTSSAIIQYVSKKAGIGIGAGRIRAKHSKVRSGDTSHTGLIPFYRLFQDAVRSCSQGSVRNGAATLHYPIWHYDVEELIVLKNDKGTEDSRVRHIDYSVQFNKLMYERLLSGGHITLFSPEEVPDLYECFFSNQDAFKQLYEAYEKDDSVRKRSVSAIQLFTAVLQERVNTGRIYLMNVDHANTHGSFIENVAPIRMSNLCQEITLPTKPLDSLDDPNGEIALCILSAINWGKINEPDDFREPAQLLVRALNELIDIQEYPILAAEISTRNRRPIGIGITGFAHWVAKKGMTYTSPDLAMIHEFMEAYSYYIIRASVDLAIERGEHAPKSADTKYHYGIVPIDTYKRDVDALVEPVYYCDWAGLREDLAKHGIYNSTLMANMPCETSSQISNSTSGIDPVRDLVSVKISGDTVLKQVAPNIDTLNYETLWDIRSMRGYLSIMAVFTKFLDQAISVNTSYNPKHHGGVLPINVVLQDIIFGYKMGIKTFYYNNVDDGSGLDAQENCDTCGA